MKLYCYLVSVTTFIANCGCLSASLFINDNSGGFVEIKYKGKNKIAGVRKKYLKAIRIDSASKYPIFKGYIDFKTQPIIAQSALLEDTKKLNFYGIKKGDILTIYLFSRGQGPHYIEVKSKGGKKEKYYSPNALSLEQITEFLKLEPGSTVKVNGRAAFSKPIMCKVRIIYSGGPSTTHDFKEHTTIKSVRESLNIGNDFALRHEGSSVSDTKQLKSLTGSTSKEVLLLAQKKDQDFDTAADTIASLRDAAQTDSTLHKETVKSLENTKKMLIIASMIAIPSVIYSIYALFSNSKKKQNGIYNTKAVGKKRKRKPKSV